MVTFMIESTFFKYKANNTIFHKINPFIKLISVLIISISSFYLPIIYILFFFISLVLILCTTIKLSLKEILTDLKPIFIYFLMIEISTIVLNSVDFFYAKSEMRSFVTIFIPTKKILILLCRLALSLSITSIFYRTTTIQELKLSLSSVEYFFNKKKQTPFSDTICLTLTFIPQISKTWTLINNSWKNRDGNNNIILFLKRISILFRLLNKNAYEKAKAIQSRK